MAIHVALHHVTEYHYDRLINLGPQVVRLRPAPHCRTPILSYSLQIEPAEHFLNWQQDPFSNYLARLVFPEKTQKFRVTVDLVCEMAVYNPFDFFLEESADHYPFKYDAALEHDLAPYLVKQAAGPLFDKLVASVDRKKTATIDFMVAMNQRLQQDIKYLVRLEPGVQTPEETLSLAAGSCRDSGWLLVQLFRHLGIAARFVSGYLIQLTPDVKSLDGPSGTTVDFTDLHAWCEIYLPGAGWIGLDPTSGLLAGEGHIPLACTPEPTSAAPVEGSLDPCEVEFTHTMSVSRIFESPRVTKPYRDDQWRTILDLGDLVDRDLASGDVRLTMGGEPTFVATTDRDAAEWNTDAMGPTKRAYATELVELLRDHYGVGGFLHFGQGKWYPGEQLPRWALSICWRTDGLPCWNDPSLLGNERHPTDYSEHDAHRFIVALTRRLGLDAKFIEPGYEDVWYYLWRERRLPVNVDPFDARLDDEHERARLRKVFAQGLDKTVGYALPLGVEQEGLLEGPKWVTGPWFLRDERMYLFPGDSPMGYRLPLDSLPWASEADKPQFVDRDPFEARPPLNAGVPTRVQFPGGSAADQRAAVAYPTAAPLGTALAGSMGNTGVVNLLTPAGAGLSSTPGQAVVGAPDARAPKRFESAGWLGRTALVSEVRAGNLYIFMPPLKVLEDYLALLVAVEQTAADLGVRLILEGYPPPRDPRLKILQVTPDPGVIEVNIHPAFDWKEVVEHTEFLYDAAFLTRLAAEKFMTDGRHTGTGGGNHFVLGGATPADSPFLRRPDLLTSLVAYWHNHPSLSYLFSGMFIGPTSQAPRMDEARNDQVFEFEVARREVAKIESRNGYVEPWLIDRALRNLLIDVTGNTHRAEFCIDKLYSPDGPTGRLGLLELRAFEMPPHARMSLVQQLLMRAFVAMFWNRPYTTRMTRWGTELHDRFLLPTFIEQDFDDVLADLNDGGYAFDRNWFAPHFEFRFPQIGKVAVRGIELQLHAALEPWHVMGEQASAGGTVRYVDSSLERVEVRVNGFNENRHVITVNGRAVPLQPTGRVGDFVAGVRFRAWHPPSALHPTIGVHAPLVFDIVDTWSERSLGGCRYDVSHPGGRNYETFPVNAYEAESRRLARFTVLAHTPGRLMPAPAVPSLEFPFTLDMRH
ncbi:transglutaminase family protein [soil metagenome]